MLAEIDGAESVVDAVERVEQFDPNAPAPRRSGGVGGFGVRRSTDVDAMASQRVAETAEILEDFQKRMLVCWCASSPLLIMVAILMYHTIPPMLLQASASGNQHASGHAVTVMRAKPQWRDAPSSEAGEGGAVPLLAPPPRRGQLGGSDGSGSIEPAGRCVLACGLRSGLQYLLFLHAVVNML